MIGDVVREGHDAFGSMIARDARAAGIETHEAPRGLFRGQLPQEVLAAMEQGTRTDRQRARSRLGIVPDLQLGSTAIFDVKTIARSKTRYGRTVFTARGARSYGGRAGGAVAKRAAAVQSEYMRSARILDQQFHGGVGPARRGQGGGVAGPVESRLAEFETVQGLVVGHYGEQSDAVTKLRARIAKARAERDWARLGACSISEANSFVSNKMGRTWGVQGSRIVAQRLLRRLELLGTGRQGDGGMTAGQAELGDGTDIGAAAFDAGLTPGVTLQAGRD